MESSSSASDYHQQPSPITKYSTRTCLQISIDDTYTIQVIIHLRMIDLSWWNHPQSLVSHHTQLLDLIQNHIIPSSDNNFQQEILQRRNTLNKSQAGPKVVADTNNTNVSANKTEKGKIHKRAQTTITTVAKKRKGNNSHATNTTMNNKVITNKNSKTVQKRNAKKDTTNYYSHDAQQTRQQGIAGDEETSMTTTTTAAAATAAIPRKYIGDFRILIGDTIQITYKLQPIPDLYHTCTLIYPNHDDIEEEEEEKDEKNQSRGVIVRKTIPNFYNLTTLSQRIVLWCFPFDPKNPTKCIPLEDGGFPTRQDMIPLASLFRF